MLMLSRIFRLVRGVEEVVATLWLFLTHTLNVQGAMRRVWAQIHVLKKRAMKSVIILLLNRRKSWPPQPIGHGKSIRRRQAPPLVVDPADVTLLGQVESKGDSSDIGKTSSKKL